MNFYFKNHIGEIANSSSKYRSLTRRVRKMEKKLSKLSTRPRNFTNLWSLVDFQPSRNKKKRGKKGKARTYERVGGGFEGSKWAQYFTDESILGAVLRRGCTPCN